MNNSENYEVILLGISISHINLSGFYYLDRECTTCSIVIIVQFGLLYSLGAGSVVISPSNDYRALSSRDP